MYQCLFSEFLLYYYQLLLWELQVDAGQKGDWASVNAALAETETQAKKDAGAEMDGKNYIDTLKKVQLMMMILYNLLTLIERCYCIVMIRF